MVSGCVSFEMTSLTLSSDFRQRSSEKLQHLGDTALNSQRYDEAVSHYTIALSPEPPSPQVILIKRSKAYLATGSWKQALDDANKVHSFSVLLRLPTHHDQAIALDRLSPWGYEVKHAALHMAGDYEMAIVAFETMLSQLSVREIHGQGLDFSCQVHLLILPPST